MRRHQEIQDNALRFVFVPLRGYHPRVRERVREERERERDYTDRQTIDIPLLFESQV